ncbi:MAG: hypothetical protein Ct9H90mP8_1950 [Pseudomonadota bacterium]|nr:MAG: hypothetical protein Ct9H90mP8_1950 [Pseudomonadota bacterium]
MKQIQGTYSIVLLSSHDPEHLYCVKQDSPLIIGLGEGCNYIGSDINAFLEHTRKAVVLDDGNLPSSAGNDMRFRMSGSEKKGKNQFSKLIGIQRPQKKVVFPTT